MCFCMSAEVYAREQCTPSMTLVNQHHSFLISKAPSGTIFRRTIVQQYIYLNLTCACMHNPLHTHVTDTQR